jgi:hypothetical protein
MASGVGCRLADTGGVPGKFFGETSCRAANA